jgi:hypothetical protein
MPTTKESNVTTTEAERPTRNGKRHGVVEGFAEGLTGSVEGLTFMARDQAAETFTRGEKASEVLRDQAIVSIKAVEDIGLDLLSSWTEITAALAPKIPSIVPVGNLDTLVKAGFDITEQLLATERKLVEAAVGLVRRQAA